MPAILKKSGPTPGDERQTPRWLFEACARSWGPFVIDCAATKENALCDQWFGPGSGLREDALSGPIILRVVTFKPYPPQGYPVGMRAWLNPPYSRGNIGKFMAWARDQAIDGWTVCCLVPFDPSVKWWRENIGDPARPHPWVGEVVAVEGRVRFPHPSKERTGGANFPSAVVVMRPPFTIHKPKGD